MTKNEIKIQILTRGGWDTTFTVPESTLDLFVDRAHVYAAGFKKWPFTEGRTSTTFASLVTTEDGYLVGEYPEGWKSESIRMLRIGGKEVGKREFYKFCKFLEDNTGSTSRVFSDYVRRYYINPSIDLTGTVSVWGQYTPAALGDESTVFGGETDGDEGIIEKGMSFVFERLLDQPTAEVYAGKSAATLDALWKRLQDEQYEYQIPPGEGMFKRFDVTRGGLNEDLPSRENRWDN